MDGSAAGATLTSSGGAYGTCNELIVVCSHAICEDASNAHDESNWSLQPFQRSDPVTQKPSEHETFILHIAAAAMTHHYRPKALVMFSGGKTNKDSPKSEAESYRDVFRRLQTSLSGQYLSEGSVALEEYATDSYQNLLFSILRFRKLVGCYPKTVTVITHAFKEHRFLELHGPAIKWPSGRLRVQGINPPFSLEERELTQKGELERGYRLFAEDPYGGRSPLSDKRRARNWDPDVVETLAADEEPEVKILLRWNGEESGNEVFPGRLPWEEG